MVRDFQNEGAARTESVGPFVLGKVLGENAECPPVTGHQWVIFRVIRFCSGRGCTGTVRLGTHKDTGFQVAFKIMKKKLLMSVSSHVSTCMEFC